MNILRNMKGANTETKVVYEQKCHGNRCRFAKQNVEKKETS